MTFTRLAGRYATRDEAEQAVRRAARFSVKVPLTLRRHECDKPAHQAEPWPLVAWSGSAATRRPWSPWWASTGMGSEE